VFISVEVNYMFFKCYYVPKLCKRFCWSARICKSICTWTWKERGLAIQKLPF